MNKTQIFKTIKSLEGFNKSIEHDSFEKSKKNTDKPFQKYEFLGDRVLGLVISEYLITTFSHNTLDEISRRFIHLVNTNTLAKIFRKNSYSKIDFFERAWYSSFLVLFCSQLVDIQYFDVRISLVFWILLAGLKEIIKNSFSQKLI